MSDGDIRELIFNKDLVKKFLGGEINWYKAALWNLKFVWKEWEVYVVISYIEWLMNKIDKMQEDFKKGIEEQERLKEEKEKQKKEKKVDSK